VAANPRVDRCHHCAEPLPAAPVWHADPASGVARAYCCQGCAGAAEWIAGAALDDYYRLRSVPAGRVEADVPDFAGWDRADVFAEHGRAVEGGCEITVLTDGMRCAACAWLIDRALRHEPGVLDAGANAVTGRITVMGSPPRPPPPAPSAAAARARPPAGAGGGGRASAVGRGGGPAGHASRRSAPSAAAGCCGWAWPASVRCRR